MLKKILNLIAKLQVKRQNEPIVVFKGKYSYESSLVMRVCELEKLADDALNMLASDAQSYGFGEQYNKIIDLLSRYADYNKSALNMTSKGISWGDSPAQGECASKEENKPEYLGKIFGLTQDEIAAKQGITKLK